MKTLFEALIGKHNVDNSSSSSLMYLVYPYSANNRMILLKFFYQLDHHERSSDIHRFFVLDDNEFNKVKNNLNKDYIEVLYTNKMDRKEILHFIGSNSAEKILHSKIFKSL